MNKREYTDYFYVNENKKVCLRDQAPEDLKDLVMHIHAFFDSLPNDWIYAQILKAFEDMSEEGTTFEDVSFEPDIYYSDLYTWFGNNFAHGMIDEYIDELMPDTKDVYDLISGGQWYCMSLIYQQVSEFLNPE